MVKFLKRFFNLIIIIILFLLLVAMIYLFIQDVNSTRAKEYFLKEHDFKKTDLIAYKVEEFVYDEDQDCGTLWFKECTKDKNLKKKSYFYIFKNKKKFVIIEHEDGTYESDYEE